MSWFKRHDKNEKIIQYINIIRKEELPINTEKRCQGLKTSFRSAVSSSCFKLSTNQRAWTAKHSPTIFLYSSLSTRPLLHLISTKLFSLNILLKFIILFMFYHNSLQTHELKYTSNVSCYLSLKVLISSVNFLCSILQISFKYGMD